ncbi:EAL domain-containing protein [Paraburkholderia sp. IMGN_8]|uniref:EAL domain-containing protein n=1 Tax=Paraburkholderia sp. IMGN_8 TaxID=3136564 RepID=UPI0031012379
MEAGDTLQHDALNGSAGDESWPLREVDLTAAIERGEFLVEYQPVVSMRSGVITCAEASLRWAHPHRGVLSQDDFNPGVERIGASALPGQFIVTEACRQLGIWSQRGGGVPSILLNLSVIQICTAEIPEVLEDSVARNGLAPSQLTLEVSGESKLEKSPQLLERLKLLRQRGYRIVLGDFGARHTSMPLLMQLPVSGVKFGRTFTVTLPNSAVSREILSNMARLLRDLGLTLTVAGVDKDGQLAVVRKYADIELQGALIGGPVSAEALPASVNFGALSQVDLHKAGGG